MRKRYTKGKKVVPNLIRGKTGRIGYKHGGKHSGLQLLAQQLRDMHQKDYPNKYDEPAQVKTSGRGPGNIEIDERDIENAIPENDGSGGLPPKTTAPPTSTTTTGVVANQTSVNNPQQGIDPETPSPFTKTTEATASSPAQREREFRAAESGRRMEDMASGETTLDDIGAKADTAKIEEQPDEILDSTKEDYKVTEDESALDTKTYKVDTTDANLTEKVDTITKEELGQANPASDVTASKMENVKQVEEDVNIEAATSTVSDEAKISEELGIGRVDKIDPSKIQVKEGSVAERVVGKISQGAVASAAKVAGISLPRVTRAKQQLARAGVSADAISLLGNDPDTLEAELMNYSEKERGLIGGLPVEALVSTQMDTLFQGMENGEIPLWAKPATDKIEALLAQRGLSASSVGRDALTSTLVGEAFKIANANAQAIQASVSQDKSIEAQALLREAEFEQQTGLTNAQNVFKMDMAQFSADQQTELSNSKFMQTISLTEASMGQQSVVQDAILASQANLAEADLTGRLRIENAKGFLAMDMANLSNEQQAVVLSSQQEQQRMLSNQASVNASKQFNATSENQTNQFMSSLKDSISKFNTQQINASEQFNAAQNNAANARFTQRKADADKFNVQIAASVDQFNEQNQFAREQFNAQNSLVIDQSNAQWRRDINKIDTAAQNAMNARNAQNQFAMTQSAQSQLWQEMRDEFDYIWKSSENAANRETNIVVAGINGEHSAIASDSGMTKLKHLITLFGD